MVLLLAFLMQVKRVVGEKEDGGERRSLSSLDHKEQVQDGHLPRGQWQGEQLKRDLDLASEDRASPQLHFSLTGPVIWDKSFVL